MPILMFACVGMTKYNDNWCVLGSQSIMIIGVYWDHKV